MADDKIIDLSKERAAREDAAMENFYAETFSFEQQVRNQIDSLRDICDGDSLPYRYGNQVLRVPFNEFVDALEKKLMSGMAALSIDEDPEAGPVARVIPLKRSVKPKKPKSSTPTIRAERVLTPWEQEECKKKREARKAERLRQREEQLDRLRDRYGAEAAQAYADLMGWR